MEVVGKVAQEFGITKIRRPVENLREFLGNERGRSAVRHIRHKLSAAGAVRVVASGFEAIR